MLLSRPLVIFSPLLEKIGKESYVTHKTHKGWVFGVIFYANKENSMPSKHNNSAENIMAFNQPIITLKQARKLIGKQSSDLIDDTDLSLTLIGLTHLANTLTSANVVPKSGKVA